MREFKLFLLLSITLFTFIAVIAFSVAYLDVVIRYLYGLVDTLSPPNRTPVFILLCSILPVTLFSLLIATNSNIHK